jgi:hypothetical protein
MILALRLVLVCNFLRWAFGTLGGIGVHNVNISECLTRLFFEAT